MSTTEMNGGAVANGDASGVTGSHITERASNRATSLMSSVEVDGAPMLTARGARVRRGTSTSSHENDSDMSLTIHYSLSVSV
jgi:hypothetical protein